MMDLNLGPICSSFMRNRIGALLVIFQVAIALAVLANSAWIVRQRIEALGRPTGLDDANLFVVSTAAFNEHFQYQASLQADLAYLRGFPAWWRLPRPTPPRSVKPDLRRTFGAIPPRVALPMISMLFPWMNKD